MDTSRVPAAVIAKADEMEHTARKFGSKIKGASSRRAEKLKSRHDKLLSRLALPGDVLKIGKVDVQELKDELRVAERAEKEQRRAARREEREAASKEKSGTVADRSVAGPKKMSKGKRQNIIASEVSQFQAVLAHSAFKANPFATISEHLNNTVADPAKALKSMDKKSAAKPMSKAQRKFLKEEGLLHKVLGDDAVAMDA